MELACINPKNSSNYSMLNAETEGIIFPKTSLLDLGLTAIHDDKANPSKS
jgi:hypothetical protein